MPNDELTKQMLSDFLATSKRLEEGNVLDPKAMNQFLGRMGGLVGHCILSMWSDDALDERVAELLESRCKTCPNTAYINLLKEGRIADPKASPPDMMSRGKDLLVTLTPWRWPLALVCFSPFAGGIVDKILSFASKLM